tara:strand:+ start:508 stop:951 length:444 start_codon:yes stop_codon:yes gene_type:complete
MKKLLSIFLFSFLLSNCSTVAVVGGSGLTSFEVASDIKTVFDVVSLVETGKTTNDHILSAVVDKDCNLFGIFKSDMEVCKNHGTEPKRNDRFADNDSFVVAVNYNPNDYKHKENLYLMDKQTRVSRYFYTAKEIQKEKLEMFVHIFN